MGKSMSKGAEGRVNSREDAHRVSPLRPSKSLSDLSTLAGGVNPGRRNQTTVISAPDDLQGMRGRDSWQKGAATKRSLSSESSASNSGGKAHYKGRKGSQSSTKSEPPEVSITHHSSFRDPPIERKKRTSQERVVTTRTPTQLVKSVSSSDLESLSRNVAASQRSGKGQFRNGYKKQASRSPSLPNDAVVELPSGPWVYKQVYAVSKVGKKLGELRSPCDVCLLSAGGAAVCEDRNHRIQVFSKQGKAHSYIGKQHERSMQRPTGVCEYPEGNILLVADVNKVYFFNSQGRSVEHCAPDGKFCLRSVCCIKNSHHLALSDLGRCATVATYGIEGQHITDMKHNFKSPRYIASDFDHNYLAVSDSEAHCVRIFDVTSGRLVDTPPPTGGPILPSGIAFSARGSLLVADRGEDMVLEYDLRSRAWQTCLGKEQGLKSPVALSADRRGNIAVTEEWHDFKLDMYTLKTFSLT